MLAEDATRLSVQLQDEGFTSKDEIQAAEGQAAERAKALGIEKERILGGMPTPFVGPQVSTSKDDTQIHEKLIGQRIEAVRKGDLTTHRRVVQQMAEHTKHLDKKAKSVKKEFKPMRDKDQCKKIVIDAQRARKMSV